MTAYCHVMSTTPTSPTSGPGQNGLYFRQLLSGRDFAVGDTVATQMRNFAYLIGDSTSRQCVVVDPAYAPIELVEIARSDGYEVVGALVTHYHADHCGGRMMGFDLPGVAELLERFDLPIFINRHEIDWVEKTTGVGAGQLRVVEGGETTNIGSIGITFLHTPGHTPGSQCFLVRNRLVSGDTVFLDGCGRTDLPGGDPEEMFRSLRRLADLPTDTDLFPGHDYSSSSTAPMGEVTANNVVFRAATAAEWLRLFT